MTMPDSDLAQLPILRELRHDLHTAFAAAERPARAHITKPHRRRRLVPVAGLVATPAAALVVAPGVGAGHPQEAGAAVLNRAAVAAEAVPSPRDDQFFYTRTRATAVVAPVDPDQANGMPTALVTKERSTWTSIARAGRLEERI